MAAPSPAEIANALLRPNLGWSGPTVTFSVAESVSMWPAYIGGEPSDPHYAALNAAQAARFAAAAAAWDQVIGVTLVQSSDASAPGQIRVAFTDVDAHEHQDIWGYAYAPPALNAAESGVEGDIWIDFAKAGSAFAAGSYDFMSTIHELGHALGLKHPFENGAVLPAAYDNHRYTVMSYTEYADDVHRTVEPTATGIRTVVAPVYPSTPMVLDIVALQARYGADLQAATGDTTYTWSESAPFMQTVYDAGGVDTFDLSAHTRGSVIDLTPGSYSSIAHYSAEDQSAYWAAAYPWAADWIAQQFAQESTYTWSDNLGIAFGAVIENVTAGSGADTVTGNTARNTVLGGAGDDSLDGAEGDDYLRGGDGNDRLAGGAGFDDINGNAGADTEAGGGGPDWVVGGKDGDILAGDEGGDVVYGNLGADTVQGGAGGDLVRGGQDNDSLTGDDGDDWLSGDRGDDTLSGGDGADVFHSFAGAGLDRIIDFSQAQGDRVQLDAGTTYTVAQSGTDTVVTLGGGDQIVLVGVSAASLQAGWIFIA